MTGSALFVFLLAGVQAVALAAQETVSVATDATGSSGHAARPAAETRSPVARLELLRRAEAHLAQENPWQALRDYRRVGESSAAPGQDVDLQLGLARTYLMLGHADIAMDHYQAAAKLQQGSPDAGLRIRILLRAARFKKALAVSTEAVRRARRPSAELLAAHASALFRVQRTVEAANFYRRVLLQDPLHAEAHLRLGSGLLTPRRVKLGEELLQGIAAHRRQRLIEARDLFLKALKKTPGHPVAHRLLGETLFELQMEESMASNSEAFATLAAMLPAPDLSGSPVSRFLAAYPTLSPERQAVAARSLSLFKSRLPKLVAIGGRHDLLWEGERTTDAPARSGLRGKRTFDGRVWDDVRGIGGLRAATGIEALDEARLFGFDTLAHEIAHQAHLFAFKQIDRLKVKHLYKIAKREGKCLDFYAASNEAEYFGQGVEAFASLCKRPGCQKTHGHTRFELYRVDPALHDLIQSLVDHDPLRDPRQRQKLLPACAQVALVSGRPRDALTAAQMMAEGAEKELFLSRARSALKMLGLPERSQ